MKLFKYKTEALLVETLARTSASGSVLAKDKTEAHIKAWQVLNESHAYIKTPIELREVDPEEIEDHCRDIGDMFEQYEIDKYGE